mgnify:CR=1 FL=1|tara:strand:+ start:451 stop:711 length:261 start_codon:yes stop_codon:yes gene_type:complete
MEIYNNNIRAISSSIGQEISGSILRVYCMDAGSLSDVKFGKQFPHKAFTASGDSITRLKMTAGSTIDGPIGEAKVASGAFLFYLRD